ncbi:pyridoxamine 5'-phosphate oxidase family protein [Dolichospermum circinale CS-1225]|uniref:Pyridoxamine 5'-phosphate oxidase family protein n=1 Tax=Dolichospermum circinale CS-537/01 TaxID=3021739 RepID=A0ABT5A993_9CYAN|nr:pyridoxamine 5'-phosphate oxidase family protein [Dolichospermum circinale]MDB9458886.1 pyridoxamine 5'-phosphate oxidase family protein [Dolichospermum circinale CS-545/17]MDB9466058.1 pyridoxamine 5'-phosphate oxidase family protein [Dolichospermum circinale CS-539/09]MDB9470978.1 pyridoxamine 5'-phosphate oxidase family protein [Dolichospermum circinale CS-539]MDB9488506.1 pyridoxamine 5'-phosphate oxidase family protein [Dolichospermum circinale CS-537/01]MDB9522861.1 pyridoxamine 5'-ph
MNQHKKAQAEYEKFPTELTSIMMSTVNKEGIPDASYAPFVLDDDKNIYIYVSGLATHTQNIHNHPFVSVLFIEDEVKTKQIFARRRLNFNCTANLVERETEQWQQTVDKFQIRFGELISTLRSLPDFRIFQLTPKNGRFVIGFGAAYNISSDNINQLVLSKD